MRQRAMLGGLVLLTAALSTTGIQSAESPTRGGGWVGTWATAVVERAPAPPRPAQADAARPPQGPPPVVINNVTLRQIVRTSIGGDRVRVVFSNVYGKTPLKIGAAAVGLRGKESAVAPGSAHPLTFGGAADATVSAGAIIVSDPAALTLPAMSELVVDLFLPGDSSAAALTVHNGARQTNYVSQGNHAGAADFPVASTTASWFFLSRVEVAAPGAAGVVATLGDSITDGYNSTPDANSRWPDHFAARLLDPKSGLRLGVVNLGIDGNKVLRDGLGVSALARLDRDVLVQTGVTHIVVLEGINDIGLARGEPRATAAELIAGHRQLIARAHARGLTIFAGTLLPYEGTTIPDYYTAEGEKTRVAVNEWIRTSKEYDGVIDFEAAMKDPKQPTKILPAYDSGDHLHPGDAGYAAMAAAIDLKMFKSRK